MTTVNVPNCIVPLTMALIERFEEDEQDINELAAELQELRAEIQELKSQTTTVIIVIDEDQV